MKSVVQVLQSLDVGPQSNCYSSVHKQNVRSGNDKQIDDPPHSLGTGLFYAHI